ncbi:MAG: organic solvent tolerance protein OstA [Planctomycetaceae bacterium]
MTPSPEHSGPPFTGKMTEANRTRLQRFVVVVGVLLSLFVTVRVMNGQTGRFVSDILGRTSTSEPSITSTSTRPSEQVTISADFSQEWEEDGISISILRGRCRVQQGTTRLTADEMVVWRKQHRSEEKTLEQLAIYAEGKVRLDSPGSTKTDSTLLVTLSSRDGLKTNIRRRLTGQSASHDALFRRAEKRRPHTGKTAGPLLTPAPKPIRIPNPASSLASVMRGTFPEIPAEPVQQGPALLSVQPRPQPVGVRRVRIVPRSAVSISVRSFESKVTTPPEQVWVLTGGINIRIDGVQRFGTVDLSADRMVVWTQSNEENDFQNETQQSQDTPFEVYMEGNVVIRQGGNVIHATQATYDAREDRGLILDAELKAFVPKLNETVRIRAERIRQNSRNSFHAHNAWTTTSKFGVPGYRLQARDIFYENRYVQPWLGKQEIDPQTGEPIVEQVPWITSLNNTFIVENLPLLYTPYVSAPAEDPNVPLRRLTIKSDRIFGTQVKTVWDMFSLTGMDRPDGVSWELYADYLSDRGPALGTGSKYKGRDLFGIPGTYSGRGFVYGILDDGRDNLGLFRQELIPEDEGRYRGQWRHRHNLPHNITVLGEFGLLSDRNFLESYYEREFDTRKDVETLLYARQIVDNYAWTMLGRPQVNDFETTTEWLPRADLYVLSEPFFDGRITWSMHSSVGYGRLQPGDRPTDPTDLSTPLPFAAPADGIVSMTRHELNAPFNIGPVRVVPYLLGEAAFWGEDFTGTSTDRFVGSAGIRSSLMFWKVFPQVSSQLLNLNGLAHKSQIESEYYITDSTRDLASIPQYNEFDDNAQERFRQRFLVNTFGGVLPAVFEPRMYAQRTGAGRWVTVPYHELIDDQQVLRMAWRHQLQTKVGPPERLRIKDWMTLDLEASFFPNANRDNFGEDLGLLGAYYRWNIGDRTSFLASAQYDLFDRAQQIWNIALLSQRGARGSIYVGLRQIKGANLDSQIVTASFSYSMGPKWIATVGTAYDLGETRNAGQSLTVTRVGADFLLHVGANFDASKGNAGIALAIEPRFGPFRSSATRLGSLLGSR